MQQQGENYREIKIRTFWDIAQCSLVGVDRLFRGAYYFLHQGDRLEGSNIQTRCHDNLKSHIQGNKLVTAENKAVAC
jgi:hypothetical protein